MLVEEGLYGRCGRRELTGGLCLKDYAQHWSGQGYQRLSEGCGVCLEGKGQRQSRRFRQDIIRWTQRQVDIMYLCRSKDHRYVLGQLTWPVCG